jgi:hypothetical protein
MQLARVKDENKYAGVAKRPFVAKGFVFDIASTGMAVSHLAAVRRTFLRNVSLTTFISRAYRASSGGLLQGHLKNGSTLSSKI